MLFDEQVIEVDESLDELTELIVLTSDSPMATAHRAIVLPAVPPPPPREALQRRLHAEEAEVLLTRRRGATEPPAVDEPSVERLIDAPFISNPRVRRSVRPAPRARAITEFVTRPRRRSLQAAARF